MHQARSQLAETRSVPVVNRDLEWSTMSKAADEGGEDRQLHRILLIVIVGNWTNDLSVVKERRV